MIRKFSILALCLVAASLTACDEEKKPEEIKKEAKEAVQNRTIKTLKPATAEDFQKGPGQGNK